jgi:hypothetical protein
VTYTGARRSHHDVLSAGLRMSLLAAFRRPPTTGEDPACVTVYECNAWKGYVVEVLRPDATRISVTPDQTAEELADAAPGATRVAIVQIDASVTTDFATSDPAFWSRLAARGVTLLNARCSDIRKRTLHAACAALDVPSARADSVGSPDERIMIKTTLNAGGTPERRLVRRWGSAGRHFARDLSSAVRHNRNYIICRRDQVPAEMWTDPTLVAERFIDNPDGCFAKALVVGSATVVTIAWCGRDIKRLSDPLRRRRNYFYWTRGDEHVAVGAADPLALRVLCLARRLGEALRLEIQATDFAIDGDGGLIPVDINKTPFSGRRRHSAVIHHLQRGVDGLLAQPCSALDARGVAGGNGVTAFAY